MSASKLIPNKCFDSVVIYVNAQHICGKRSQEELMALKI